MKKSIIILLTSVALFCSCSLEEVVENAFVTSDYFQNESQVSSAVFGAYEPLRGLCNNAQYVGNVGTDECRTYSGSIYGEAIDSYGYDSANTFLVSLWTSLYLGVNRANAALEGIETSPLSDELKLVYSAEARFLRGLYYYYIVRYWGEAPLRLESSSDYESSYEALSGPAAIYDVIIEDFKAAAESLPSSQSLVGRATSGAAYSFLASAYLSMTGYPLYKTSSEDYQNIIDAAQAVIDLDIYSLLPDYADVFASENHVESIFEFQAGSVTGTGGAVKTYMGVVGTFPVVQHQDDVTLHYPDLRVGSTNIRPNIAHILSYEDDDERYATNIGDYILTGYNSSGVAVTSSSNVSTIVEVRKMALDPGDYTDYSIAKFKFATGTNVTEFTNTDNPLNFALMRYSELLLIMAEAQYHRNGFASAQPYFEEVSSRAGTSAWDGTGDITERMLLERGWELCFECKRFFDLQRYNMLYERVSARDDVYQPSDMLSFKTANISSDFRYYPIPQIEYDYNLEL